MSDISWVFGILQRYGAYTDDMAGNPDKAFKALEELQKSGKLSESDAKTVSERTGGGGDSKPSANTKKISDTVKKSRATERGEEVLRSFNSEEKPPIIGKKAADPLDLTSVSEQIIKHKPVLDDSEVVAKIPDNPKIDKRKAATLLKVKLSKNGGIVEREEIGEVEVGEVADDVVKYIKTKAEALAMSAVPDIIQDGIIIDGHKNHKGEGVRTLTFAGRVEIDGKPAYMAVVVQRTTKKKYKVHRIITPDGKTFEIEKPPSS